ncbi:MAG: T9SS type A sorting domain-containing protein [Bacteroidia bacterium]|nr:T9SS type A sorting domain-containing protein [Bacteroidia bacterium]NNC84469.1 T9SS type A sorting domain-containing protein [Bacteroidia bacterium]NNM16760.1 T9SS type A sorting domain-containing protein [Bacteroidia bacterium]
MKKSLFLLLSFLIIGHLSFGQLNPDTSITVRINGSELENPWVGGFNAPHFSEVDLDQDGVMDLFAFDRGGDRISTYINTAKNGQVSYKNAPHFKKLIPPIHDWALFVDFNCDGKSDLFSYSYSGGMTLYKNTSNPTDGLQFELEHDLIYSYFGLNYVNLYVSPVNQPVLIDVDGDSDLDVITFTLTGSLLEFHENYAMDSLGRCDTLMYRLSPGCWGNFTLSPFSNSAVLGISCRIANPTTFDNDAAQSGGLHSGSCMMGFDVDNDNDIDLINGDLLGNNLLLLVNGGDNQNANITSQDTTFPSYDVPVNMASFPASYFVDVDNDNAKDLIVAPCTENDSENFTNILFYKNTATTQAPIFEFTNGEFLVEDMIEVGAGANVELFDVNQDGLMDMLIGNYGYYAPGGQFTSGIAHFENTGTSTKPEFDLITRDYEGMNALNLNGIHPCFGDLDGDLDDDMLIGDSDGKLHYFRNTAGAGMPASFTLTGPNYQGIDVGQFSAPFIFDLNGDGLLDLIVGERDGSLNYFENTGTTTMPVYNLTSDTLGGLNVKTWWDIEGYSDPILYNNSGNIELLVGSKQGSVHYYDHITGNIMGNYSLIDSTYADIDEDERTSIARFDIDGDAIEDILTGNYAGGAVFYSSSSTLDIGDNSTANEMAIYPNPTESIVNIELNNYQGASNNHLFIYNVTGQVIFESVFNSYKTQINTSTWVPGVYFIKVDTGDVPIIQKLIVR